MGRRRLFFAVCLILFISLKQSLPKPKAKVMATADQGNDDNGNGNRKGNGDGGNGNNDKNKEKKPKKPKPLKDPVTDYKKLSALPKTGQDELPAKLRGFATIRRSLVHLSALRGNPRRISSRRDALSTAAASVKPPANVSQRTSVLSISLCFHALTF